MHPHTHPLCIRHLLLFQSHRSIYISKKDEREGPLCALFLTPEMIWFISPSTEISAIPPHLCLSNRRGEGASEKRDLSSRVWSRTHRTSSTELDSCAGGGGDFSHCWSMLKEWGGGSRVWGGGGWAITLRQKASVHAGSPTPTSDRWQAEAFTHQAKQ